MNDNIFNSEYDSESTSITEIENKYMSKSDGEEEAAKVYKSDKPYRQVIKAKISHDTDNL